MLSSRLFVRLSVCRTCGRGCTYFLSCLMLADGSQQKCIQYWQLIDKIIQQVALQTKEGNPDVTPLDIDVRKLLKQFVFVSLLSRQFIIV